MQLDSFVRGTLLKRSTAENIIDLQEEQEQLRLQGQSVGQNMVDRNEEKKEFDIDFGYKSYFTFD